MSQDARDTRLVIKGKEARDKLLEGAQAVYETVTATFGPKGSNVLVEKPFGRPVLTRDGVTVARETYFQDRAKNMGAQLVLEASETTNRLAGDGTTATVALSYNLLKNGEHAITAGMHPMQVKKAIMDDSLLLLDELTKISKDTKKSQLKEVASVSSGDPLLGQLIAEAMDYVGPDGGIMTEKAYVNDVEREYVDGYYLQSGFEALQMGRKEMSQPAIIVAIRRITSPVDVIEILTRTAQFQKLEQGQIPRIVFVGNIDEAAYGLIVENINRGTIDAIVIKTPPTFGNMGPHLLEDIAIYAGCTPLTDNMNLKDFSGKHIGSLEKVVALKNESTLYGNNKDELVQDRIGEIKELIENEISDNVIEKYRDRIAKLEGKIALFKIGGATDTEKEEKEFRIEDSIQATRAAYLYGVVPGGASTLLHLSKVKGLSEITRDALRATFQKLLENANFPVEIKLAEALAAPTNHGFNLRKGDELVDLVKEGILDPTLVVENVIKNSASVAANALTVSIVLNFVDKE